MSRIPEVTLDDRGFQDLVNEARLRLSQRCPEWSEHNVSDPGITLVELFAWMTEAIIYRLNRVPEKLHVTLLNLLGIKIEPPVAATTELRFRLTAPSDRARRDPRRRHRGRHAPHAERPGDRVPDLRRLHDPAAAAGLLRGQARRRREGHRRRARASPKPQGAGSERLRYAARAGDALYLGFDVPLANILLVVDVDCSQARGAGVDPEDPPLRWEVSAAEEETGWLEARWSRT